MEELELGAVQLRFADIIWSRAPIASPELVKICGEELEWKKSTTYTVLKKLCDRGLFINDNGVVKVKVGKEEFLSRRSQSFVEHTFSGSLPAFVAAFISGKELTEAEAEQIQHMIDSFRKGEGK